MTIYKKADWKLYNQNFVDKFKKINPEIDLFTVLFDSKNNSFFSYNGEYKRPLGCLSCIDGEISQSDFGDITIGGLALLNYKNFADENNIKIGNEIAEELSTNVWICPNCHRWIFDFLPKYDTMSIVGS